MVMKVRNIYKHEIRYIYSFLKSFVFKEGTVKVSFVP